jgi:D-alanyl-D-alanine carboxypeptidase/D-alanyl-D-alanine-endopeptidase (penicillin-binding protein 4)
VRRGVLVSAATVAVLVAGSGYVTADVLDVAPGVLTLDRPEPLPTPTVSGTPAPVILPEPQPAPSDDVLTATGVDAPLPSAEGLEAALTSASNDPDLEGALGIAVGDGLTGEELWSYAGNEPRVPASTVKLMSALAISDSLDLERRMTTSVVAEPGSSDLVLVARGDTLLSPGEGKPDSVLGHAGLGDLAQQVASRLASGGTKEVRLRLDLSWAPGPRFPAGWDQGDVLLPWARPIVMTGLATQLGEGTSRVPRYPEREVASAFSERLEDRGVTVEVQPESTWSEPAPDDAEELGSVESATYGEVLDHTLDESDNPLTENLVRQAAATAGEPTEPQGSEAAFIEKRLVAHGVPTDALVLKDASGLSPGQAATPRTLAAVLALATTNEVPQLRRAVAALPVSGLTGTLTDRFDARATEDVAGVPRAKTGTLLAGSGLAGTTVDSDGRLLTFVVLVDGFPGTYDGIVRARAALDRIVAALTRCGCRSPEG